MSVTMKASYQIECVARVIQLKEANNKDASFERGLLKSWAGYPEFEDAGAVLKGLSRRQYKQQGVSKIQGGSKPQGNKKNRAKKPNVSKIINKRGRPKKSSQLSRTTIWRRQKELQGNLI